MMVKYSSNCTLITSFNVDIILFPGKDKDVCKVYLGSINNLDGAEAEYEIKIKII